MSTHSSKVKAYREARGVRQEQLEEFVPGAKPKVSVTLKKSTGC